MPLRKLVSVIACIVIAVWMFFGATVYTGATTTQELEAKLEKLRQKDAELAKKAQNFRSLTDQTKRQIVGIKTEISDLNYGIQDLESEIQRTQNSIELATLQIEKLGLEIIKTLDQINASKHDTIDVLKKLYQAERVSQAELVLSQTNFSEFWSQRQYFSNFQTSLNNLIHQMEALKADLETKSNEQTEKRQELQGLAKQKEVQQGVLSEQRNYQNVLLTQSEKEKKQYEISLTQAEGERRKVIEDILRTEEEVKRMRDFEFYFKSGKIPPAGTKLFVWPAQLRRVSQGYGATAFARSGVAGYRFHNGIDIDAGAGTPIFAAAPGKIIGKNTSACPNYGKLHNFGCQGGWGNWIAIKHPNDLVTLYAHMATPSNLFIGKEVGAREQIGFIGASGNVTGPHLHFSVYTEFFLVPKGYPGYNQNGTLNPILYF